MRAYIQTLWILAVVRFVLGDGVNWIDPYYAVTYTYHPNPDVEHAVRAIVLRARSSAKQGPFTVTKGNIFAPSGKRQDYLSWAPYHWPRCNWCRGHGAGPVRQQDYVTDTDGQTTGDGYCCPGGSSECFPVSSHYQCSSVTSESTLMSSGETISTLLPPQDESSRANAPDILQFTSLLEVDAEGRNPSRTQSSSCNPSPTTSMAPTATWTTCPYEARDGQVNNDRNQLQGLSQLNLAAQSIIDNTLAFVLDRNSDAAENASRFIDTFFIDKKRGLSPHLEWGQTIRGPSQRGSYMGILDLRVLVKVANAIQILRMSRTPHWSSDRDNKMVQWAKSYINWLEISEIGKRPRKSANNHSSFYHGQLVALKILVGDKSGALNIVQAYFAGPFREQIVSSGEQPFESTRTKPFHYRAFNIEAMISLAKLGDYLGAPMWNAQTRYKSTIKTAVDYLITLDAGREDTSAALPLVAAAMAAYGDDQRRTYRKYLESHGMQTMSDGKTQVWKYMTRTWWFYEHPDAVRASHNDHHARALYDLSQQEVLGMPVFGTDLDAHGSAISRGNDYQTHGNEGLAADTNWGQSLSLNVPVHPERPSPFVSTDAVELEEGIYVYWNQISHLYKGSALGRRSIWAKW